MMDIDIEERMNLALKKEKPKRVIEATIKILLATIYLSALIYMIFCWLTGKPHDDPVLIVVYCFLASLFVIAAVVRIPKAIFGYRVNPANEVEDEGYVVRSKILMASSPSSVQRYGRQRCEVVVFIPKINKLLKAKMTFDFKYTSTTKMSLALGTNNAKKLFPKGTRVTVAYDNVRPKNCRVIENELSITE